MNTAYIIQSWYLGGIETGVYDIASYLKNKHPGFNFHFIATDNKNIHPRFNKIGQGIYLGRDWEKITNYLRDSQIDILQWGNESAYAKCGHDAGVPTIIERIAGPRSLGKDHSYNSHIIASSNGIAQALKKEWDGPTTVIKNGVQISGAKKDRLGFSDQSFVVAYPAARMGEGQAYDHLIEAVKIARVSNPEIKLVLMGDHPEHAGWKSIKERLVYLAEPLKKNCLFTGFVLDPEPIIAGADLICVPAKDHGISNALILGAALGVPLVATKVGQTNEICVHNDNGYLVKVGDVKSLARYILYLSMTPSQCKTFGERGREIVAENHNLVKQAERYGELYGSFS